MNIRCHSLVTRLLIVVCLVQAPSLVGAADTVAERIAKVLEETVAQGKLASLTIHVNQRGKNLFDGSEGFADLEQNVRATPAGLYGIGSITKSMTAYCILTLSEQGKLQLTDRLGALLPDYQGPARDATVTQLLTHTAGVPDYAGNSAPDRILDPARAYSQADVVALFAGYPAVFPPGTRWQYSNSGYYLLGLIIEKVTGQSYADAVHDLLIAPLGLSNIKMDYRDPLMPGRVRGYSHDAQGHFQNASSYDATIALAAGGYRATASDLASYIEQLFGDKVPAGVHGLMVQPVPLSDGTPISYRPIALFHDDLQGHERYSHAGGIWGFVAHATYFPADQVSIAVLTNTSDGSVSIANLSVKISRIVLGLKTPTVADLPLGAREASRFVGTYCMRQYMQGTGRLRVSHSDSGLTLAADPAPENTPSIRLRNQGSGRFVMANDDEAIVRFGKSHALPALSIDTPTFGTQWGVPCEN